MFYSRSPQILILTLDELDAFLHECIFADNKGRFFIDRDGQIFRFVLGRHLF